MAQIAAIELARPDPILRTYPPSFGRRLVLPIQQKGGGRRPRLDRYRCRPPRQMPRDHHGLTGTAALPWPTHATAQMPASAASPKNGTNGGTSAYAGTTGGG